MGINVNSLSPTQAREYWHDYNNGNKKGISNAEYASLCTKFKSEIKTWEKDENTYTYRQSPEDRLDFDEDDAGFFQNGGTTSIVGAGASVVGAGMSGSLNIVKNAQAISTKQIGSNLTTSAKGKTGLFNKAGEGQKLTKAQKADNKETASLLVTAAMQLTFALITKAQSPNKDAAEACEAAQNELYNEQAILADQVLTMEEMQEEMAVLQEEAEATNEEGQADIATMEGMYNYYYTKYQNGTATDQDISLLKALGAQMGVTQSRTGDETEALNGEITEVGEGYEEITANIDNTNNFTDYVSEIDDATKDSARIQAVLMGVSCASAAATSVKCFARASATNVAWFATAAYIAAGVASATASYLNGDQALKQLDYAKIASNTEDIRHDTQDLSVETTEFQEVSTEFWEETVDATSEENLFTLTPTYSKVSGNGQQGQNGEDADKGKTRSADGTNNQTTTNGFGALTGGAGTTNATTAQGANNTANQNNNEQDDKDKNKQK